ncbi:MAG: tetratricopeptide repeat protein [Chloroflexi bacterium]|nr:tetratricopeptide repeat protein [Chloroflexota bacterium]
MPEPTSKLAAFLAELKRRRVFRVAIVYAGVTFVIIQIIDGAFPAMHIPDWVGSLVVTLLLLGFPAAVGLAWAFDITEKGVVRTPAKEGPPTPLIAARPAPQTPPAIGQDAPETAPAPSIAVLPFMDLSPEKDQDYFCDGMAEELIDALTKIKDLRVSARTSAFSFKGQQQDIREIGQKLNVATVLEGSVRKSDTRLRISAQLINVADGYHLWSEKYDRELKDVFAIQDEIAGNIVQALRVMLSPKEKRALGKVPTTDVEAYDVYLRGRKFFHQFSRKNIAFARQMFNRATQIDPDYALAYAGIADCHSWLYMYWESTDANLRAAEEASRKALELDTDLAEAHVAHGLAVSLSEQYDEAEREFETAIRLDPRLFEAYYFYARTCWPQGKPEKAAELFEKACEVNPEDYQGPLFLANTYNGLGRKTKAETAYRRSLEIIERHLELNPDDARAHYLGANALIQLGEGKRGLKWARRALAIDPGDALILYNVACIYALSEEIEEAIDYLEKSAKAGATHKEWIEHDSDLDPLRSHPHFQTLLAQMS